MGGFGDKLEGKAEEANEYVSRLESGQESLIYRADTERRQQAPLAVCEPLCRHDPCGVVTDFTGLKQAVSLASQFGESG